MTLHQSATALAVEIQHKDRTRTGLRAHTREFLMRPDPATPDIVPPAPTEAAITALAVAALDALMAKHLGHPRTFFWPSVRALKNYSNGHVIVVADTHAQATELALVAFRTRQSDYLDLADWDDREYLDKECRAFLAEMQTAPEIINGPKALLFKGSD